MNLCGLSVDAFTEAALCNAIMVALSRGEGGVVLTLNLDILRRWVRDPGFRRLTEQASHVVADGMPLLWAGRLQGEKLSERVAGADLLQPLAKACAEYGHSIFLLGGTPGSVEASAVKLKVEVPGSRSFPRMRRSTLSFASCRTLIGAPPSAEAG